MPPKPSRGIHTLDDLSDRDSPGRQEYHPGGEKSGMLVQDPSKGNQDVDAIFVQARQLAAVEEPFDNSQQPESVIHNIVFWSNGFTVNDGPLRRLDDPENDLFLESIRKSECPKELVPADRSSVDVKLIRRNENCPEPETRHDPFPGVGRSLGSGFGMLVQDPSKGNQDVDAIFKQARQLGAVEGPFDNSQQPESVIHNIVFWSNGFTVNDGPLQRLDDPENDLFLESIRKSECPKELVPADRRSYVDVKLIRRNENHPSPSSGLSVDTSLPATSIRLKFADGTRTVERFNFHHTIGDIRAFIDASRPRGTRAYQLQTVGAPGLLPKQLTDMTQTIDQADLGNSVIEIL